MINYGNRYNIYLYEVYILFPTSCTGHRIQDDQHQDLIMIMLYRIPGTRYAERMPHNKQCCMQQRAIIMYLW